MSLILNQDERTASTSAASPMDSQRGFVGRLIMVSGALSVIGTSSVSAHPLVGDRTLLPMVQTTSEAVASSPSEPQTDPASVVLLELRRLSGLTWDQLARVFGVDRRSLHFWASGKPLNPTNEARLRSLLALMRQLDRGTAQANRTMLLTPGPAGQSPYELMVAGNLDQVETLAGQGLGRMAPKPAPLSAEAGNLRVPLPPEDLAGALQDSVHVERGRLLASKPLRQKQGG